MFRTGRATANGRPALRALRWRSQALGSHQPPSREQRQILPRLARFHYAPYDGIAAGLSDPPPSSSGSKSPSATVEGSRPSNSIMAMETKIETYGTHRNVSGRVMLLSVRLKSPKKIINSSGHLAPLMESAWKSLPARQKLTANPHRNTSRPTIPISSNRSRYPSWAWFGYGLMKAIAPPRFQNVW